MQLTAKDEGRHLAGTDALWGESWYHDWASADGTYGGYLRLGLYPNQALDGERGAQGIAWYWVALVREGRPLVLLRDHAVPAPTTPVGEATSAIEVSSPRVRGSWQALEPLRSYRITTEGTAVELADPASAFDGERGPEVSVSLDLTWDGVAAPFPYAATTRFEQSARVRGEVTIGGERIAVECPGQRDHSWGVRDWWQFPWVWCSGRLDDGTWWHCARSALAKTELFQTGYVITPDMKLTPVETVGLDYDLDAAQLPLRTELRVGDLELEITPELHAPLLLVSDEGKRSRFPRAMCSVSTPDGRSGHGWLELNFPEGVEHLKSSAIRRS
jgi:hypothetical protein